MVMLMLLGLGMAIFYLVKIFVRVGQDRYKDAAKAMAGMIIWFGVMFLGAVANAISMANVSSYGIHP